MVDKMVLSQQDHFHIHFSTPNSTNWCHVDHFLLGNLSLKCFMRRLLKKCLKQTANKAIAV